LGEKQEQEKKGEQPTFCVVRSGFRPPGAAGMYSAWDVECQLGKKKNKRSNKIEVTLASKMGGSFGDQGTK